ncbi:MAG: hypothetical protein RIS47_2285, partial [Bacteroidota bacterium]
FPQGVTNMENLLSINLHDNYFDDTFPSEMLENPELITLNLSSNFIRGPLTFPTIPSKLEYLGLSDNELTGNLPEEIGSISTLKYLYISRNKFSGMVPSSLTLLDGLIEVNCGFNQFEGSLPDNFRSANLQYLDFDSNKFTGSIPQSYGSLRKLKTLKLYSNKLTGTLPKELGDLTLLENLELNANLLTGTIPEELSKLRSLKLLSLRTNKFYGNIPDSLSKLALLEKFYIYDNYFTSMPDFSQLTNMEAMQVLNNKFEFDQLEKNMSVCSDFQYLPMRDSTLILNLDNSEPLSIGYIPKGTANSYKWFFMNEEQVGKTAPTIYKENVFTADLGIYTLEVRNAKVPGLVLKYHFDVRKTPLIPIVTIPKPYCVGNSLVYLETASNGGDTYWYWDKALTELIGEGNKIMIQLTQNQDTLYVVNRIANSTSESVEIPLYIRPDVRFDSGVLTAVATDGVKYQWFENGVEIGTGPSITVGDGLYWLSVSKDGCVASSETMNILHGVLGTDEYTSASSVKLFPNPARESVAIEWKSSYSGKVVLHIYDQSGRLVKTEGFNKQQPQANCQIDVSRLAHGNYQVKINEGKSQTTRKLIKL